MGSSFQNIRLALRKSKSIRGMAIPEEYLTRTYCWNNSLLHSAIRRTTENEDDVNLDNVQVLLEMAKEKNILNAVLSIQMRWEGDDESVQINRFEKVNDNLILMSPITFAIYKDKKHAIGKLLAADKDVTQKTLKQDMAANMSSTHSQSNDFYYTIAKFDF